ncbi:lysoplasmalogenase [Vibrio olivae]|uniref:Lysoplasmalogenase n=1 Tax=Vibrio olivae TaxID=1243002 RepID=A0ABV5HT74_9VIBR
MWSWLSVALSGFISISANQRNQKIQAAIFQAFSFVLLLTMVAFRHELDAPALWIAVGLLISVIADSLYILKRHLKLSFVAFLLAQLSYSKSFWLQLSGDIVWWVPSMLFAGGIVVFFLFLPKIDRLIFPVAIMGMMLLQLNWAAGQVWLITPTIATAMGMLGTMVLAISAGLLAVHDHRRTFKAGQYWISGSYLLAHSLITASLII